jgi:hypothetical protein
MLSDLVIIELTVTRLEQETPLERLLRALRTLTPAPGIILLRPINKWYSSEATNRGQIHKSPDEAECATRQLEALSVHYGLTYLDQFAGVSVGSPEVAVDSPRLGAGRTGGGRGTGLRWRHDWGPSRNSSSVFGLMATPRLFGPLDLLKDSCHPSPRGERVLSDLVLRALDDAYKRWQLAMPPEGARRRQAWLQPAPMAPQLRAAQYTHLCLAFDRPGGQAAIHVPGLPSKLALPHASLHTVRGWDYVAVGARHRLAAVVPNATLTIEVDTRLRHETNAAPSKAFVDVEFIESDLDFGMAEVRCEARCACAPVLLDGRARERRSTPTSSRVQLTVADERCLLRISLLARSPARFQLVGHFPRGRATGLRRVTKMDLATQQAYASAWMAAQEKARSRRSSRGSAPAGELFFYMK